MIQIEYDGQIVSDDAAQLAAVAVQGIVADVTGVKDTFVYANISRIRVNAAPLEIFIYLSDYKIKNLDKITEKIRDRLAAWKKENNFGAPANLTVIPMYWRIEFDV